MRTGLFLIIVLAVVSTSCRKSQSTAWESDWTAPIAYGRLDLSNLIADGTIEVNPDSTLNLVFEQDFINLTVGEVVEIPDTTVVETINNPIPGSNTFTANSTFIDQPREFSYDAIDAALTLVKIKSGTINYRVESPLNETVIATYGIPGATKDGVPFSAQLTVPGAPTGGTTTIESSFDLAGYELSLTGISGNEINTFETSFKLKTGSTAVNMDDNDVINVTSSFEGIEPQFALGYFGQETVSDTSNGEPNTALESLLSGTVDVDQLRVTLYLENGVGVDGRIRIDNLTSINPGNYQFVALSHPVIGQTVNINRATHNGYTFTPSRSEFVMNSLNSNIEAFLENLPTSVGYQSEIILNPLGNVSNGTDFAYCESAIRAGIKVEMPLALHANAIILQDTFDVDIPDLANGSSINSMSLTLRTENHFPLEIQSVIYLMDTLQQITDTITGPIINSGTLNTITGQIVAPATDTYVFDLSEDQTDQLKAAGKLMMRFEINTPAHSDLLNIYENYYIDVELIGAANATIIVP